MRLCCPVVSPKLCQCIQRYLITEGQQIQHKSKDKSIDIVINKERAAELYELHRKAKELIKMKVPRPNNKALSSSEIRGVVHLRTKEYEEFVLLNRERLKKLCNLCERGVQRVLCYSNNYLHKQLKTSPNGEARIAGKSTLVAKQLPNITTLFERKCCNRRCTRLSITHGRLLERWRERALLGQRDARAVLAEMLTPAGGAVNCCTFLHLVTGCSPGLLSKVKKEMKQSAGIREPPEHGLREYWRRKKINAARSQENNSNDEYNDPGHSVSTSVNNTVIIDSDNVTTQTVTDNHAQVKESVLSKNGSNNKFINKKTNKLIDNVILNANKNNSNIIIDNTLNYTHIQNIFTDNYNQKKSNVLALGLSSNELNCNNDDRVANFNLNSVSNNDYESNNINLLQSMSTTTATNTSTTSVSNINMENNDSNNSTHIQFIDITKLSSIGNYYLIL
ncbi:uncharacterized protein LOC142329078 isoform X2 [Lycorma delicatula]